MTHRIVSVGYEQRSAKELVDLLTKMKVVKLIDVRELPLSRKKGLSKTKLSNRLLKSGIQYQHIRQAGNPHRKLKANIEKCLGLYNKYLQKNPDVVASVELELGDSPVAILCFERNHAHCHRSVLMDLMKKRNRKIEIVKV